jgi:hypothetical protein
LDLIDVESFANVADHRAFARRLVVPLVPLLRGAATSGRHNGLPASP